MAYIQELGHLRLLQDLNVSGNPIPSQHNRPCLIQQLLFFSPFKPLNLDQQPKCKNNEIFSNVKVPELPLPDTMYPEYIMEPTVQTPHLLVNGFL